MKNIGIGVTLIFFIVFYNHCVMGQQLNVRTSTKHSGRSKKVELPKAWKDAKAEYELGLKYYFGKAVPKDYARAARMFRKAAEQGHVYAQFNLGTLYDKGQGVSQDYAKAAGWYRKAAEQGYAYAQNDLGVMYAKGWGVSQDYAKAAAWYRKAAEQGNVRAQKNLGVMYDKGEGVNGKIKVYKKTATKN